MCIMTSRDYDSCRRDRMKHLTSLPAWQSLQQHFSNLANHRMQDWFANDTQRFQRFSIQMNGILLDYSKNRITEESIKLLCALAKETQLAEKITALFAGDPINSTERRAVRHTALRENPSSISEVQTTLEKVREFTEKVRKQQWRGATGKPIRHIVNIGIGGSHLGPLMTTHALAEYALPDLHCHFISNIDGVHLHAVLGKINPEETLFIISSKSFTTLETLTNAKTARLWLTEKLNQTDLTAHFIAVTAEPARAKEWGIPDTHIFPLWEWVGGRYSIWSAIGLPLVLLIGMENFSDFLAGAHEMDVHFQETEFSHNMPVIMALLDIWYINFFGAPHRAIVPYGHQLHYFPDYIQQADMESNGKSVTHQGHSVDYLTGPIIFGKQGCDAQHSFFQLLHQGPHIIPIDFILIGKTHRLPYHHDVLIASGLSQSQALMQGKSAQQAKEELLAAGYSKEDATRLAAHKAIPGNRPNNVLFLNAVSPRILGALIALYEHKIFTQSVIWNINAFDQWGVELGKQLLPDILTNLQSETLIKQDASTAGLIAHYKKLRNNS